MAFKKKRNLLELVTVVAILFLFLSPVKRTNSSSSLLQSQGQIVLAAETIFKDCGFLDYREECYAEKFGILTQRNNIGFSKQVLLALQEKDATAVGCHLIAHAIALSETRKNPDKWKELLESQDYYLCTGGFLHGVLEAHSGLDPDFELKAEVFPEICNNLMDKETGERSCNHNLGHLLLAEEFGDIQKSVNVCVEIADFMAKYECLSGMFMENLTRLNLVSHGVAERIVWNRENTAKIEDLCAHYRGIVAKACWKEISYMYSTINNAIAEGLFNSCKKAPEKEMQDECFIYGAGNMVVFSSFKSENLGKVCKVYNESDPLYVRCMQQIIGAQIASSTKLVDRVIGLCADAPNWFKRGCFAFLGGSLARSERSGEKRLAYCKMAPVEFREACSGYSSLN